MAHARSWHVPGVRTYNVPDPSGILNVVFLQRMTDIEQQQVRDAINAVDEEAVRRLNIGHPRQPRPLQVKKWIRDYFPPSASILEIATAAHADDSDFDPVFNSIVFVDSGWDMGNVIVAHWERQEADAEERLTAVRVPMGIANVLLNACDRIEGLNLSHALGRDAFDQGQVDFYKDLPKEHAGSPSQLPWPSHLPDDIKLDSDHPTIISLRHLDDVTITQLKQDIRESSADGVKDVQIYNWEGPEPTDRLLLRDLYNHVLQNADESSEKVYAFFFDYMLHGANGEPQILAVSRIARDAGVGVEVLPVFTSALQVAWYQAAELEEIDEDTELVDIWKKEHVDHLNTANCGDVMTACPVFFQQPFSQKQERRIRAAVCALGDVEDGQDWGHLFIWHGYIFKDEGKDHTLEDLRDLFESCDPMSPFFNKEKAGFYRLHSYPYNFVALDDKVLDPEVPKVWMASSLDFHGEDVDDDLGWTIGRLDAKETSIIFVNFNVANSGPDECLDEGTIDQLWLSDLKAYREEDWPRKHAGNL